MLTVAEKLNTKDTSASYLAISLEISNIQNDMLEI